MVALSYDKESVWKAHCLPVAPRCCKCHKKGECTKYLADDTLLVRVGAILDRARIMYFRKALFVSVTTYSILDIEILQDHFTSELSHICASDSHKLR